MKAVLAYSGGLDTSCAISWLKEDYGFDEVVAVLVDVGQEADFQPAIARGYGAGADDVILLDRKDTFAEEIVAKALLANALYEGKYPLISALSRPVIGEAIGEIARELEADAVVHGCTGKGNDQVRFELAFKATYPGVAVIAPLRDKPWSRDEEIAYAAERGIPIEAKPESPFSIDDNLFGRAIEAGVLEDPWAAPPEEAFVLTVAPSAAADPVEVVIGFEAGLPVSLDGEELPLAELVTALNGLAGSRGIGRIDMIENRVVGIKSRELYEAPAALTLIAAHDALEDLVLTKAEQIAKRELEPKWAQLVYDGFWFSPVRVAYDAFFAETQKLVAGQARVKLESGAAIVTGRRSPHALYAESLASYGAGETFPHESAEGFITLLGLEAQLAAARQRQQGQVAVA
jgi:argininosuccinate synthase